MIEIVFFLWYHIGEYININDTVFIIPSSQRLVNIAKKYHSEQ